MPKRDSRIRVIEHHLAQLEALKGLQPNATPERWRAFSDGLVDVAVEALRLARELEAGRPVDRHQFMHLAALVRRLPDAAPRKGQDGGHAPDETR
jgi:hypothetical protein